MTIRLADDNDLPAILELFKISLGEEGGIPEASFWKWKHEQNPFGKSPTLLAWEGTRLIGLRTFLCWRFRHCNQSIYAYRAVDTATHPAHRGKGIFKTLTQLLTQQLKQGVPSLIFNTPNAQSKPGYLKMGWKEFGKTPLWIQPQLRYGLMNRVRMPPLVQGNTWSSDVEEYWSLLKEDFCKLTNALVTTDYDLDYLRWRYRDIPGFTYYHHVTEEGSDKTLIFYRLKQSGKIKELRITDIFFNLQESKTVKRAINEISSLHKPDMVTVLSDEQQLLQPLLPFGFISLRRAGLTITYRDVNDASLTALAAQPKKWFLTSGTIELF